MTNDEQILAAAIRELAELDAKRAEVQAFVARYRHYQLGGPASGSETAIEQSLAVSAPRKGARVDVVMSAVHDILTKRKDAMSVGDILDALIQRSVIVGGKNPKANLSQKLSASRDLKSYGKRGWYFADIEPPIKHLSITNEEGPEPLGSEPFRINGATNMLAADTATHRD
jgi:hypothetical protein